MHTLNQKARFFLIFSACIFENRYIWQRRLVYKNEKRRKPREIMAISPCIKVSKKSRPDIILVKKREDVMRIRFTLPIVFSNVARNKINIQVTVLFKEWKPNM